MNAADIAAVAFAVGVLLIFAGLAGRVVVGVLGGVVAMVALSRLVHEVAQVHLWVALAAAPPAGVVGFLLLRTAIRARKNKDV